LLKIDNKTIDKFFSTRDALAMLQVSAHMNTCTYNYIPACMNTCTYNYIPAYMNTCTYNYMPACMNTCTYNYIPAYTYTYTCTCAHTCTCTNTCIYNALYTHTHTLSLARTSVNVRLPGTTGDRSADYSLRRGRYQRCIPVRVHVSTHFPPTHLPPHSHTSPRVT
jgi:hypothetical protein